MHDIYHINLEKHRWGVGRRYALRLSLRPLLALRIAFRECDVFFLGTASKNGGNNSSNESRGDAVHLNDVHVDTWGKKDARFGRKARAESVTVAAMTGSVLSLSVRTLLAISVPVRLNLTTPFPPTPGP